MTIINNNNMNFKTTLFLYHFKNGIPSILFLYRDILQGNNSRGKIFKSVYLSLFIIKKLFLKSEYLLLFKLNWLMVPIGKKSALSDHESSLKNFLSKLFLARCHVPMPTIYIKQ